MILPQFASTRNTPLPENLDIPPELTQLSRWACWRSRTKKCKDRYKDGVRAAVRVVYEALHPLTGRELAISRPDEWVCYDIASRPQARKPFGGVGFLVRGEDGLAVVRHAHRDVLASLGGNVVHVEQEVDGDGLAVIVRAGVVGAKTGQFVPLSGRKAYQEQAKTCPDGIDALSGRNPYQENGVCPDGIDVCPDGIRTLSGRKLVDEPLSGRNPYQENGVCPDGTRTLFSSSPQNNYSDDRVRTEVEEYAKKICEQGRGGDPAKWVYGLVGVLRQHTLTPESIPTHLLLTFAEGIGEDVGRVQRLLLARWDSWKPHRVPLADALKAVQVTPSLLTDLSPVVVDRTILVAAGMCKYMGKEGLPFPLPGRVLAEVLGLSSQQDGSDVVRALVKLGLIRLVKEARYADKKSAEYVWVENGNPVVSSPSPPLDVPAHQASSRPGHSNKQTEECPYPSKLGGFLRPEHYFAELMIARRLARDGKDLPGNFWSTPSTGREYGRQVNAAHFLLKTLSTKAMSAALFSKNGRWVFSLAAPEFRELVKAEQCRLDRQIQTSHSAEPSVPAQEPPRPHFAGDSSLIRRLKGL